MKHSKMKYQKLLKVQNVGFRLIAKKLSQMFTNIQITIPEVKVVAIDKLSPLDIGGENVISGAFSRIKGKVRGNLILLFSMEDALKISDMLLERKPGTTQKLGEEAQNVIKEAANILAGSCLANLSKLFHTELVHEIPVFAFDLARKVQDIQVLGSVENADKCVILHIKFIKGKKMARGVFVLLLDKALEEKVF